MIVAPEERVPRKALPRFPRQLADTHSLRPAQPKSPIIRSRSIAVRSPAHKTLETAKARVLQLLEAPELKSGVAT